MDDKVLKILKKRTFNMFNDKWYVDTVNDIFNVKKEQKGYIYFVSNGLNNQIK